MDVVVGMDAPLVEALGKASADVLRTQLSLATVGDLLRHYPRRYLQNERPDGDAPELLVGEHVTLLGEIESVAGRRMKQRRGHLTEVGVRADGHRFSITFFNQPWRAGQLAVGMRGLFSGELARYRDHLQLAAPDLYLLGKDEAEDAAVSRIPGRMPIYPATKKLSSWAIMNAVRQVLDVLDTPPDPVPLEIRARHGLVDLITALHDVHRPNDRAQEHRARRRLLWDEAFGLQLALHLRRRVTATDRPAPPCPRREDGLAAAFDRRLPFTLTPGQAGVGGSLAMALGSTGPLNRLLQGEVGSGKTVVALRAMLQVVDAGRQAVLLAPTEVLAGQHARSLRAMLGPMARAGHLDAAPEATTVTLLTGSLPVAERRRALLDVQSGVAGIVVGTHAVIQESVGFADLGLVVVDEQHRFGVEQRDQLRSRPGPTTPHVLVMTATPIPRTVAMTLYGDLDTSMLDQLPAGRSPVTTRVVPAADRPAWLARVWTRTREEVAAGHQVFVVCPRIGDDAAAAGPQDGPDDGPDGVPDDLEDASGPGTEERRPPLAVADVAPGLAADQLAGLRLEVLHGRLPAEEKDAVMRRVADGEVDVLVATTVIEVGVDVPNATLMVVLDAERFGVTQLHQLRGRVGRGAAAGTCLLVSEAPAGSAPLARLEELAATSDGFAVADLDLRLRREGDVLGGRQSGRRSTLQLLSVLEHGEEIAEAREAARHVVDADPTFAAHPELAGLVRSVVSADAAAFLDRL